MVNFTDSAMKNATMPKQVSVLVFAAVDYTANIVMNLSEFYVKANLSTDLCIGLLMAVIFVFSKVLFNGT